MRRWKATKRLQPVGRLQAWHYLIPALTVFWIIFAVVIVSSGFSFLVISALTVVAVFSLLVVALAWAFQNNI